MKNWDYSKTWYHGSPQRFTALRKGSTITQERDLARVFSHRPHFVSQSDNGKILHSGETPGFLYHIAEDVGADDVYPHPHTTMSEGQEWLITRDLQVTLIGTTHVVENERLTQEQIEKVKKSLAAQKEE